jgi:hypothetical protein
MLRIIAHHHAINYQIHGSGTREVRIMLVRGIIKKEVPDGLQLSYALHREFIRQQAAEGDSVTIASKGEAVN